MELDQQLASTVQRYQDGVNQQRQTGSPSHVAMDAQRVNKSPQSTQAIFSTSETQFSYEGERVYFNAEPNTESYYLYDQEDYYTLTHNPRGVCMVISNESFFKTMMKRRGTLEDAKALHSVFTRLGFMVVIHNNLTAEAIRSELTKLGKRNFLDDDALVVCILSHGEEGIVLGTDELPVSLRELTQPFKSGQAPTLAGKPKLFFIEGSQGSGYQRGSLPCPPRPREEEGDRPAAKLPYMQDMPEPKPVATAAIASVHEYPTDMEHFPKKARLDHLALGPSADLLRHWDRQNRMEEDAGRVEGETVPWDADFLLGMATVPECVSFRNTLTGSIYTQELCRQLNKSAESSEDDDILTVLTRVNREVSRREYQKYKQMPEYKSTLTKKLVLKFV